ncbi:chemotaxis protein CheW [Burkholderiaceae bacterium FT117]|uniref:hypothetical protein n=1 Tax=Zeimonas sediminis TaxID=2944268 RepID=UPI002342F213|nr:hypothetical protein [Zeimonas sediminis]MCM5571948.1 chemotaxis protein CheW [Zeimonas sediminis]
MFSQVPDESPSRSATESPGSPAPLRFGASLSGVPVLFPSGERLEYLPDAAIWRLPLGPRRVAGLMQLRGHPVPVFDASAVAHDAPLRAPVLVVGATPRAAAVIVDAPPEGVAFQTQGDAGGSGAPLDDTQEALIASAGFRRALAEPVRDTQGRRWWPVDTDLLFECLASEDSDD